VRQTYDEARAVTAMIKRDNTRSIRFFARRGYAETDAYTNCERVVFRVKALEVEIT
jgi:hypothetical protein